MAVPSVFILFDNPFHPDSFDLFLFLFLTGHDNRLLFFFSFSFFILLPFFYTFSSRPAFFFVTRSRYAGKKFFFNSPDPFDIKK